MSGQFPEDTPSVDDFEFVLAEDLKKEQAKASRPPQAVPTDPGKPRKKSLADRAKVTKKLSALEALQLAEQQAREEKERKEKAALAKKLAAEAVARVAAQKKAEAEARRKLEEEAAEEEAAWARQMFGSSAGPQMPVAGKKAKPPAGMIESRVPHADPPRRPEPEPEPETPTQAPVADRRSGRESRRSSRSLLGSASRRSLAPAPVEPAAPDPPTSQTSPGALDTLPDGATVKKVYDTVNPGAVDRLMQGHLSRAGNEGDLGLTMALAEVCQLLEDDPSRLSAARVEFGGEEWALWMRDGQRIGAFLPADLYLIGL